MSNIKDYMDQWCMLTPQPLTDDETKKGNVRGEGRPEKLKCPKCQTEVWVAWKDGKPHWPAHKPGR